jgi:hypothetical protein
MLDAYGIDPDPEGDLLATPEARARHDAEMEEWWRRKSLILDLLPTIVQ